MQVQHSVEFPQRYRLIVDWDTIEHHTVGFRESEDFQRWRALVGEHFAAAPAVEHSWHSRWDSATRRHSRSS